MRMAGQVWFPPANQMGQGCATKPENYPGSRRCQGGADDASHFGDPEDHIVSEIMAKAESQKSLSSWTKEEWGTKSGKNSTQGKNATGERYLPKKARESLSDKEYARSTARKRAATRKGKQFSKQPDDIAKKTARHRR